MTDGKKFPHLRKGTDLFFFKKLERLYQVKHTHKKAT